MDPLILHKLNSNGKKARQLGYDQKADIWSLGAICYEMLIGRSAFDAEDMDELVSKVESGKYKVPTNLSKEVVSFLNGMLQYDSKKRLDINQLTQHKFITQNVKDFHRIDLRQVTKKLDETKKQIVIDVKRNRTIWAIFNKDDERKLMNIGDLAPIAEANESQQQRQHSLEKKSSNSLPQEKAFIPKNNTFQINNLNNLNKMGMANQGNQGYNNYNYNYNNQPNNFNGPYLPLPMQGIPGNQMYNFNPQMQIPQGGQTNQNKEGHYIVSGGIYNKQIK